MIIGSFSWLLALWMQKLADTHVRGSALFPSYEWRVVAECPTGAALARLPLYPGKLGVVQNAGCTWKFLDVEARRVDFHTIENSESGGTHTAELATFAVPLEWTEGMAPIAVCSDDGACEPFWLPLHDVAYPVSQITVSKKFTKPPPAEQKRIESDRIIIARAFVVGNTIDRLLAEHAFDLPRPDMYTSVFGAKRVINKDNFTRHLGVDFDGNTGDPIVATAEGVVVLAHDLFYSGNSVILAHGLGLFTTYFHLSSTAVKTGDFVHAGQSLGRVGKTGRVTGPHLHFAAKLDGMYFEPLELFEWRDAYRQAF